MVPGRSCLGVRTSATPDCRQKRARAFFAPYIESLPLQPPCPWTLPPQQLDDAFQSLGEHLLQHSSVVLHPCKVLPVRSDAYMLGHCHYRA